MPLICPSISLFCVKADLQFIYEQNRFTSFGVRIKIYCILKFTKSLQRLKYFENVQFLPWYDRTILKNICDGLFCVQVLRLKYEQTFTTKSTLKLMNTHSKTKNHIFSTCSLQSGPSRLFISF